MKKTVYLLRKHDGYECPAFIDMSRTGAAFAEDYTLVGTAEVEFQMLPIADVNRAAAEKLGAERQKAIDLLKSKIEELGEQIATLATDAAP